MRRDWFIEWVEKEENTLRFFVALMLASYAFIGVCVLWFVLDTDLAERMPDPTLQRLQQERPSFVALPMRDASVVTLYGLATPVVALENVLNVWFAWRTWRAAKQSQGVVTAKTMALQMQASAGSGSVSCQLEEMLIVFHYPRPNLSYCSFFCLFLLILPKKVSNVFT